MKLLIKIWDLNGERNKSMHSLHSKKSWLMHLFLHYLILPNLLKLHKITLVPLSPREVSENQNKMRETKEKK